MSETSDFKSLCCIDHPLIAVRDLAAAKKTYADLGFSIPPRGSHVEWGTGNLCIMFPEDYLELRGVLDRTKPLKGLDHFLSKHGEGIMGLAFGTTNCHDTEIALRKVGVTTDLRTTLSRNFEHSTGWTQPRFELLFPDQERFPDIGHVVVCQHLTPELMRPPGLCSHPNAAHRVLAVHGRVRNIEMSAKDCSLVYGHNAVESLHNKLTVRLPSGQKIVFQQKKDGEKVGLFRISIGVTDLASTLRFLRRSGVPVSLVAEKLSLVVPAEYACGLALEFDQTSGL